MKFKDVSLDDIESYFNTNNDDFALVHADYEEDNPSVLNIFRFDGEYDDCDTFICSVYKDDRNDIIVDTEAVAVALNFGDGYIDNENEDITIKKVIEMILVTAKMGICEYIDFQKRQIEFIDGFAKTRKLSISSIETSTGTKYKAV